MPVTLLLPNKIKDKPYYSDYDREKISRIPAKDFIMDWFRQRIPIQKGGVPMKKIESVSDRILLIRSGTGSGKSTTLAPELYLKFYKSMRKTIGVTQPRILTTMSIPNSIVKPGENVNTYFTGDQQVTNNQVSNVAFVTVFSKNRS